MVDLVDPNVALVVIACVAIATSFFAKQGGEKVKDLSDAVTFDFFASASWFALAIVWVFSTSTSIVAWLFAGFGIMFVVWGISDSLDLMGALAAKSKADEG